MNGQNSFPASSNGNAFTSQGFLSHAQQGQGGPSWGSGGPDGSSGQQQQHQMQDQQQHQQQQQRMQGQHGFYQQQANDGITIQPNFPATYASQGGAWPPMSQNQLFPMPFLGNGSMPGQAPVSFFADNSNQQSLQQFSAAPSQAPAPASAGLEQQRDSGELEDDQKDASSGPVRSKTSTFDNRDKVAKAPIAAPVKAACTFCRSRKSRCDGKQPCATCIAREKVDDCLYTISRRGGKPKAKKVANPEVMENHLRHLVMLSEFPHTARHPENISNITNVQDFSSIFPTGRLNNTTATSQTNPNNAAQSQGLTERTAGDGMGMFGFNDGFALSQQGSAPLAASAPWQQMPPGSNSLSSSDLQALYGMTANGLTGSTSHTSNAGSQQMAASNNSGSAQGLAKQAHQLPGQGSGSAQDLMDLSITGPSDPKTLLEDYYKYLHRFIPVLPSPVYIDALTSSWDPQSPFLLALQALLPLLRNEIQPADPLHSKFAGGLNFGNAAKKERVRQITNHFEKLATEAVDRAVEGADGDAKGKLTLGVIQALCVLTIFDYGSGRAVKARLKADQALSLAMAEGFHRLKTSSAGHGSASSVDYFGKVRLPESEVFEMKKRCWWTVWSLGTWAAYNTGNASTLRADDPRITCELPNCADTTAWIGNVRSLQTLLNVQEKVIALSNLNASDAEEEDASSPNAESSPVSGRSTNTPASLHSFGMGSPLTLTGGHGGPGSTSSDPTRRSIFNSMLELDRQLEEQIDMQESYLSAVRNGRNVETFAGVPSDLNTAEDALIAYLHTSATVQLYTSSLTLHIGQAFHGASLFERKLCFLNPNKGNASSDSGSTCREPIPSAYITNLAAQNRNGKAVQAGPSATNADGTLADIFNPFSWMTQNFGEQNPADQAANGTAISQVSGPVCGQSQYDGSLTSGSSVSTGLTSGTRKPKKKSLARGPFSAQHSLGRCVRASIRLLEIASNKRLEPNPFNACSFVLISYVLLMLAMSRSVGTGEENDDDDDDEDADKSGREDVADMSGNEQLLQLAGLSTDGTFSSPSLQQIWNRVQQARDSLAALSEIWDMVGPIVGEITSCLETSRALFSENQ
ncbi:hypothetical protein OC842_001726 [Tilletia horrida]|uniref:Zn(2)-C6 fungal-type domain-containing protein n=1 Tax=Tilletia horrida TaxID=155126 RepID=A0AAN6JMA4_9BASI|nr:hypothetical protein OC842_001726 [Tilletia horrida]KAK0558675.1 hypothetical protein OC844_004964 [Tilletia horrida]